MFDIGFWETMMIGLVTLLVVGPERLPKLARTAGLWIGKARYYIGTVKADIEREIRADELKRVMEEQAKSTGLHEIVEETRSSLDSARSSVESLNTSLDELTIDRVDPPREDNKAPERQSETGESSGTDQRTADSQRLQ